MSQTKEQIKNQIRELLGISEDQENKPPVSTDEKRLSPEQETLKNEALAIMGVKKNQ